MNTTGTYNGRPYARILWATTYPTSSGTRGTAFWHDEAKTRLFFRDPHRSRRKTRVETLSYIPTLVIVQPTT